MEDDDGTCLLDVLCDPQALSDFLHGTIETDELLCSTTPAGALLFPEDPSPPTLLEEVSSCQGAATSGCVDLSFLEEALVQSPERSNEVVPEKTPTGIVGQGLGGSGEFLSPREQDKSPERFLRQPQQDAETFLSPGRQDIGQNPERFLGLKEFDQSPERFLGLKEFDQSPGRFLSPGRPEYDPERFLLTVGQEHDTGGFFSPGVEEHGLGRFLESKEQAQNPEKYHLSVGQEVGPGGLLESKEQQQFPERFLSPMGQEHSPEKFQGSNKQDQGLQQFQGSNKQEQGLELFQESGGQQFDSNTFFSQAVQDQDQESLHSSGDQGSSPERILAQGGEKGSERLLEPGGIKDEDAEEEGAACDILQQSLQEADITEQTLAIEAGLAQSMDISLSSIYQSDPLLSPPPPPVYSSKPFNIPNSNLSSDTQVVVEPPHPSLLAVGPGCPSLKQNITPQFMGVLPGHLFPAPSPDTNITLSAAQASSLLIQKTVSSVQGHPLLAPTGGTLTNTAASTVMAAAGPSPGIVVQRGPLPIQPKLPVNIQPRLVQISPKPLAKGHRITTGMTLVPGTTSSNILLTSPSPSVRLKPASQLQPSSSLHKPVSLQLINQSGSIVIQPHHLFHGQGQFLLPGHSPISLAQSTGTTQQILPQTSSHRQPLVPPGAVTTPGSLVDGSQILTVPQRQLNLSPVLTTPTGQLTLRQGTLLSGPLQLQSTPPSGLQVPAQLAGAYPNPGQGHKNPKVVHNQVLGNQITLINGSAMLSPQVTSISIVNGAPVLQGLPLEPAANQEGPPLRPEAIRKGSLLGTEVHEMIPQQRRAAQPSVLLLPETATPEKKLPKESLKLNGQVPSPVPLLFPSTNNDIKSTPAPPVVVPQQALPTALQAQESSAPPLIPSAMPQSEAQYETRENSRTFNIFDQLQKETMEMPSPHPIIDSLSPQDDIREKSSPCSSSPPPPSIHFKSPVTSLEPTAVASPAHCGTVLSRTPTTPACLDVTPSPEIFASPHGYTSTLHVEHPGQLQGSSGKEAGFVPLIASSEPPGTQHLVISHPESESLGLGTSLARSLHQQEQQHDHNTPGSLVEPCVRSPSPLAEDAGDQPSSTLQIRATQESHTQADINLSEEDRPLSQATRQDRIQVQLRSDHNAVLSPMTHSPFVTLKDAVRHLLPYHTLSGRTPSRKDLSLVDEQFATSSSFLLNHTLDMQSKYRQLLLTEAQQSSPSAEMVMLERLFLQSEKLALVEDRRKASRNPESFLVSVRPSSPSGVGTPKPRCRGLLLGSSSSPPAWALRSDRPPGLKTYQSNSRGALRLTIKHTLGASKIVHNFSSEPTRSAPLGHKRHHSRQLVNGGSATREKGYLRTSPGAVSAESQDCPHGPGSTSPGALSSTPSQPETTTQVHTVSKQQQGEPPKKRTGNSHLAAFPLIPTQLQKQFPKQFQTPFPKQFSAPSGPKHNWNVSQPPATVETQRPVERTPLPPPPPLHPSPPSCQPPNPPLPHLHPLSLREDGALSLNDHLQTAIDSILELQRLQGPSVGKAGLGQA